MKTSNFTHLGGLKGTQNRLAFMQDGYNEAFAAIAKLCGDKTILHGVEVDTNNNVSAGWIAVNGELIRFIGGTLGTDVVFSNAITPLPFADGSTHDVHFDKTATCGSSGSFSFVELQPLTSLKYFLKKDDLRMCVKDNAYVAANFDPVTGIGITPEEKGWMIFEMAYPDGAGKVFMNKLAGDGRFDEAGKVYGEYEHTQSIQEMPNHTHNYRRAKEYGSASGSAVNHPDGPLDTVGTSGTGGGQPMNITQPSFVVLTLIKL